MKETLRCIQVNLHHAKAASDVLSRRFTKDGLDLGFIQEPWIVNGSVKGLSVSNARLLYNAECGNPRAALLINKNTNCLPIPEFITRDLVAAVLEVPTSQGRQEVVIASAYFPGDSEQNPPEELRQLLQYCNRRNRSIMICCDANAHHTIWGSSDINKRGEYLLDFLLSNNLEIVNRGNKPTFANAVRQEVLDLTLSSPLLERRIINWHVSDETSLSDHKHIRFDIEAPGLQLSGIRVPKLTDWDSYLEHLGVGVEEMSARQIVSIDDLELISTQLKSLITSAFESSCPVRNRKATRDVPWWNRQLEKLRKKSRRLFNRAKRTGDWDGYRAALTEYSKELRRARRRSWKNFSEEVDDTPTVARLQKVLVKDHTNGIGFLQKADGSFTENKGETLELLMKTHFPESIITDSSDEELLTVGDTGFPPRRIRRLSSRIFTKNKVKWAINSFKPYKSPGADGIFPKLLQVGLSVLLPYLVEIFRASYALKYIPESWRDVKVIFIPKGGGRVETHPKSYRPISLTSFLLKAMEKILDHYIRSEILTKVPLHSQQFAYQPGKSTVTALHSLVHRLERALKAKDIALCAFLDIEGAFDNTSYQAIEKAAERKLIDSSTTGWIKTMLECRKITAELGGHSITIRATRGCPQGGVLSPLLWSLVVDELLHKLSESGILAQGYADDIVLTVEGKCEKRISARMQKALNTVQKWCEDINLRVNPHKTTIVPFTRRRRLNLTAPILYGTTLDFSKEVKYLGLTLDQGLTWNPHVNRVYEKSIKALWACNKLFGKTWGLKPRMSLWAYLAIVRPMVTYAALIWWPKVEQKTTQKVLHKIQRSACLSITGAMSTCPTLAIEALLDLTPLHIHVMGVAVGEAIRLLGGTVSTNKPLEGHLRILEEFQGSLTCLALPDSMPRKLNLEVPIEVVLPDRQTWLGEGPVLNRGSQIWYTDGSKMDSGVGAGVYGPDCQLAVPMGSTPTIFQAEIHAIERCAREINDRNTRGANIIIMSDSQAALKALHSYTIESKLVWNCLDVLKYLAEHNKVTLVWVPGHRGIPGNELADELARQGASLPFIGPEPFCGLTKSHVKGMIRTWEESRKLSLWEDTPGLRQAKKYISFSPIRSKQLLRLRKVELRTYVGLLTGHCPLRYHLKKMGIVEDDTCRLCLEEAETSEHILCSCEAIGRIRFKHLGKAVLSPDDVKKAEPKEIVRFFRSLDLDWWA